MKTNQVMVRPMGQMQVFQRTKDSMFNATAFIKQWNSLNNSKKEIKDYLNNKATKEYIETMKQDPEFIGGILPMKKSRANKGINAGTWMHPFLFIDFAMWLNPKFKLEVIKFVKDQLIKYRHNAGDYYNCLSASGAKLKGYNYSQVAIAMNWIVFNRTGKNLRQTATPDQLKELSEIEQKLSFAIDMGYIKSFHHLLSELRKMWHKKYSQKAITYQ